MVVAMLLGGSCAAFAGESAEATYEAVFGGMERAARASSSTTDDVKLAAELWSAAQAANTSGDLRALVLRKAFALGLAGPAGYQTAVLAAKSLGEHYPHLEAEALGNLLRVRELQTRTARGKDFEKVCADYVAAALRLSEILLAGEESAKAVELLHRATRIARSARLVSDLEDVAEALQEARVQETTDRQIQTLKRAVEQDSVNADGRLKLARIYLVEKNDPNRAARLLAGAAGDEELRTMVPLACKGVAATVEEHCLELGDWYRKLAEGASKRARLAMLNRAKQYYDRFCELHPGDDPAKSKATMLSAVAAKKLQGQRIEKDVTIPANSETGWELGPVIAGAKIRLSYLSGAWKGWGTHASENPDRVRQEKGERCRLAIVALDPGRGTTITLAVVPPETATKPFVFRFRRATPKVVLRINDTDGDFKGNPGQVVYRVTFDPGY